jgi:hypothetical protein
VRALPQSNNALVVRTDFSGDAVWSRLRSAIETPVGEFRAYVTFVDDRQYDSLTIEQLLELVRTGSNHMFIFLVDRETVTRPEHPILVVDLFDQSGRSFRVIPSEMWGVENSLSLANMDWEEFADNVDDDGVFRGFPE